MTRLMEMSGMEVVVTVVATLIASVWVLGLRSNAGKREGVTKQTTVTSMLFSGLVVSAYSFDWSPFHLLWLFPAGFVTGFLSLYFPFSLLNIPAAIYFRIVCIGAGSGKANAAGAGR